MHLIVSIVSITAILIFDERKAAVSVSWGSNHTMVAEIWTGAHITHSLLLAERGAGMSQRTRRP